MYSPEGISVGQREPLYVYQRKICPDLNTHNTSHIIKLAHERINPNNTDYMGENTAQHMYMKGVMMNMRGSGFEGLKKGNVVVNVVLVRTLLCISTSSYKGAKATHRSISPYGTCWVVLSQI